MTGHIQKTAISIGAFLLLQFSTRTASGEEWKGKTVLVQVNSSRISIGSKVVGTVRKGQALTVLQKKGKWLGVKWQAASGESKKGWITVDKVALKGESEQPTPARPERMESFDSLLRKFIHDSKESRRVAYKALDTSARRDRAIQAIRPDVIAAASDYFDALKEVGRERLLKEHFRSDASYLQDGEDKAFEKQRDHEKYAADYSGIWGDHVWLMPTGAAVGLRPKSKKIVALMKEAKPDKYGVPAWVRNGPVVVMSPEKGKWKISGLAKMGYAYDLTKMLRRQKAELKE